MSSPNGRGRTHGPRFGAGYQFPATDAIGTLVRQAPILEAGPLGVWQARVALVPMTGGRPNVFSVEAVWSHQSTGDSGAVQALVQGELAREAYLRLVDHFKAGLEPPDAIPVPPDATML